MGTAPEAVEEREGTFRLRDGVTLWARRPPPSQNAAGANTVAPVTVLRVGHTTNIPSLQVLQQFEGTVCSVTEDEFVAVLRDMTHPERSEEQATFSRGEVVPDDQALIQEGAVFHWTIAYKSRPYRLRVSEIRFRRMPVWSEGDLSKARAQGAELHRLFGAEA